MAKNYGIYNDKKKALTKPYITFENNATNAIAVWYTPNTYKLKYTKDKKEIDHKFKEYKYNWYYKDGVNNVWIPANAQEQSITSFGTAISGKSYSRQLVTYSVPANAVSIKFTVRLVMTAKTPKKQRKKNKKDIMHCPKFSTISLTANPTRGNTPAVPSQIETSFLNNNTQLVLTATISQDEVNKGTNRVYFDINRGTGKNTYVSFVQNLWSDVKNDRNDSNIVKKNRASVSVNLNPGNFYIYRARAYNTTSQRYSAWTEWSAPVYSKPSKPDKISASLVTATSARVSFHVKGFVDTYEVIRATKEAYLDLDNPAGLATTTSWNETVKDALDHNTVGIVDGLELGNTYWFKCRATSSTYGSSEWSDHFSLSIGKRPGVPSTYSSKTAAMIGDTVNLYWVHNAQDGSSQTNGKVELYSNSTDESALIGGAPVIVHNPYLDNLDETDDNTTLYLPVTLTTNSQYAGEAYPERVHDFVDGDTLYWRVATRGVYEEGENEGWSDWSTMRRITMYQKPEAHLLFKSGWLWNPADLTDMTTPLEDLPSVTLLDSYPFAVVMSATPTTQKVISFFLTISNAGDPYEVDDPFGSGLDAIKTVNKDEVLYSKFFDSVDEGVDNQKTVILYPTDIDFEDGQTYNFHLEIYTTAGLSNFVDVPLVADLAETSTFTPEADIEVDEEQITAYITPRCYDYDPDAEGPEPYEDEEGNIGYTEEDLNLTLTQDVLLDVYRIETDGTFTEIATGLPNEEHTVIDHHPSLDYARYRIIARKTTNAELQYIDDVATEVGIHSLVIQWEEEWTNLSERTDAIDAEVDYEESKIYDVLSNYSGNRLILPWNIDTSEDFKPDVQFIEYIGREHPVSYYGTQKGQTASWSTDIDKTDTETLFALRKLARYMGDCYVREPFGTGYWANVQVNWSQTHNEPAIPVSLSITRVEGVSENTHNEEALTNA